MRKCRRLDILRHGHGGHLILSGHKVPGGPCAPRPTSAGFIRSSWGHSLGLSGSCSVVG